MTVIKTLKVTFVCDGCSKELESLSDNAPPPGWYAGTMGLFPKLGNEAHYRFNACSQSCVIPAMASCLGLKAISAPPVPEKKEPLIRRHGMYPAPGRKKK